MEKDKSRLYELIYQTVMRVPRGKVATYGQIARLAGLGRHARLVGYALHNLPPGSEVPWQRVINAQGRISLGSRGDSVNRQQQLLEQEGVEFGQGGRVNLKEYGWDGDAFPLDEL